MKKILEAVVGSQAYGLSTPESDEDRMGIVVFTTSEMLSLRKPSETIVRHNPDIVYHEVEKFMRLAIKNNPSVLELLFLEKYDILTDEGRLLIKNRHDFLSKQICHSYGGYAIAQARKLNRRGHSFSSKVKNRYSKHARHCFRLLWQGAQLLTEQTLTVKIQDKEKLFEIGNLSVEELVNKFEEEFKKFNNIETKLPDRPNYKKLNEILLTIREMNNDLR